MAEVRRDGLQAALVKHRRMSRARWVVRVSPLIVEILNRRAATNPGEHFRAVGTHELYAYESVAGITVEDAAVATRDIDMLWDVRRRVSSKSTALLT